MGMFALDRQFSWQRLSLCLLGLAVSTALLCTHFIDDSVWGTFNGGVLIAFVGSETVRHWQRSKFGDEGAP